MKKNNEKELLVYAEIGWNLSPAFDINPNETRTGLKLNIDEVDNSLDIISSSEIVRKAKAFRV